MSQEQPGWVYNHSKSEAGVRKYLDHIRGQGRLTEFQECVKRTVTTPGLSAAGYVRILPPSWDNPPQQHLNPLAPGHHLTREEEVRFHHLYEDYSTIDSQLQSLLRNRTNLANEAIALVKSAKARFEAENAERLAALNKRRQPDSRYQQPVEKKIKLSADRQRQLEVLEAKRRRLYEEEELAQDSAASTSAGIPIRSPPLSVNHSLTFQSPTAHITPRQAQPEPMVTDQEPSPAPFQQNVSIQPGGVKVLLPQLGISPLVRTESGPPSNNLDNLQPVIYLEKIPVGKGVLPPRLLAKAQSAKQQREAKEAALKEKEAAAAIAARAEEAEKARKSYQEANSLGFGRGKSRTRISHIKEKSYPGQVEAELPPRPKSASGQFASVKTVTKAASISSTEGATGGLESLAIEKSLERARLTKEKIRSLSLTDSSDEEKQLTPVPGPKAIEGAVAAEESPDESILEETEAERAEREFDDTKFC